MISTNFHDIWINLWSVTVSPRNGRVNFSWQSSSGKRVISSTPLVMLHTIPAISRITLTVSHPGNVFDLFRQLSDFDGLILKLRSSKISNIISHYTWPHLITHLFPSFNTHAQTTSNYSLFSSDCLLSPLCLHICWYLLGMSLSMLLYKILLIFHCQNKYFLFYEFLFLPHLKIILTFFAPSDCLYSFYSRTYSSFSCASLSFLLYHNLHRSRNHISFL